MGSNVSKKRRKSSLTDSEARSKTQMKILMAEETPEPIYDLSECLLRHVPCGTYAKCKVMRKLQLLLQDNLLTSLEEGGQMSDLHLLQVLRLDFNCFSHIPSSISALTSLQVLNISNNTIKHLPESVGELRQLRQLLCRCNGLRALPSSVGCLPRLRTLDVRNNQLTELPPLENISRLETLRLEENEPLTAPPADVIGQGSDAVIAYLCQEAGAKYTGPSDGDDTDAAVPATTMSVPDELDNVQEKIQRYDMLKESRRLELLELERRMTEAKSQEGLEVSKQEEFRKQLLDELAEGQARLDADVARVAEQRERDHRRLLDSVARLEQEADEAAAQVAAAAARLRDPAAVLARLQLDRRELEQLVVVRQEECDALRQHEVMESMKQLMKESCAMESQLMEYQRGRDRALQEALSQDQQMDAQLKQLLEMKGSEQEARIQQLIKDEAFQRQAFFNLYLQQDASRLQILHQISEAEEALMRLTMVEAEHREDSKDSEMARLSEKRRHLTALLVQLMEQQAARERELQRRLVEMDEQRRGEVQHYWLVQYQRLLDSKPERVRELEETLDARVKTLLQSSGAEDYLTLFAAGNVQYKTLLYMNDADLLELGVSDLSSRAAILRQTAFVRDQDEDSLKPRRPSAPPASDPAAPPSAPPAADMPADLEGAAAAPAETGQYRTTHTELECVVCMDHKTEVIFLNCGHLCVCRQCSGPLSQCPMCRQSVLQKLIITSVL